MKRKLLAGVLTGISIVLSSAIAFAPEARASTNNTYYCAQLQGQWSTFVNTPRGRVKLIGWEKQVSDTWTPKNRCLEVSGRFQRHLEAGTLKYIRTGIVNNLPVICVAQIRGGDCPTDSVLITFEPETDPEKLLIQLVDFRRSVTGGTIVLNENDSGFYSSGEFYVDLDKFIDQIPAEE